METWQRTVVVGCLIRSERLFERTDVSTAIDFTLTNFACNDAPGDADWESVESHFGCALPEVYKSFTAVHDGGEGFIGDQYLVLWRKGELIEFNCDYQVADYAPGLLLFGSNGAGEAFAFDCRDSQMGIRVVPFIGMNLNDATFVSGTFDGFLIRLNEPDGTLF